MRGAVVLLALLFLAANSTTYEPHSSFTLDDTTFSIEHLFEDRAHIRVGDFGSIWRVDDCEQTTHHHVCLEAATNTSADISVTLINRSYSVTRSLPDTAVLGEPFPVEFTIENHAPEERVFTVQDSTNAQTRSHTGLDHDLYWSGIIPKHSTRTFSYQAIAHQDATFRLNISEPYKTVREHRVEREDFIDITATYTNQTTTGSWYNFSLDVRSDQDAELSVRILHEHLEIGRSHNLSSQLGNTFLSNQSPDMWFSYRIPQNTQDTITVVVTAETDKSITTRNASFVVADAFTPLTIIHDYHDTTLPAYTNHTLSVTFHNPNNRDITAQLTATSVLADLETEITIPQQDSVQQQFVIAPNSTDSTYAMRLSLSYEDPNGVLTTTQDTLRIHSTEPHPPPSTQETTQEPASVRLAAQQTSTGYALLITPRDFVNTTGVLTVTHFSDVIFEDTIALDETFTLNVTTHGSYTAHINSSEQTAQQQHAIQAPTNATPEEEVVAQEPRFFGTHLLTISATVLALIFVFITARILLVRKRLRTLVETYERAQHLLATTTPTTPQDLALRKQLEEQVVALQEEIFKHKD